jgi:predicted ribosomally synthesized peptide with SipW-like signal peptide
MSARKTLPIGIIVMTLMIALAGLGVGYASWTEQLTAGGSIQTGSIDVKMEDVEIGEDDPLEVGRCEYELTGDEKGINLIIQNAYPGYRCKPKFYLTNHGTVPAKVMSVNITNSSGEFDLQSGGVLSDSSLLNPGIPMPATLDFQVSENATEDGYYQFSVSIDIAQGNAP